MIEGGERRRQWHPTPVLLHGKSHGQKSLEGCSLWGRWESDTTERCHFHFSLSCIGEGNGNPLQCSCLENPRDGGACWAAVYGVAQSRTRLKLLSSRGRRGSSKRLYVGIFIMFYIFLCILGCFNILGFPGGSVIKNLPDSAGDAEDVGSFPGLERSPGGQNGNPLQYSCLENSMDREAWQATVHE